MPPDCRPAAQTLGRGTTVYYLVDNLDEVSLDTVHLMPFVSYSVQFEKKVAEIGGETAYPKTKEGENGYYMNFLGMTVSRFPFFLQADTWLGSSWKSFWSIPVWTMNDTSSVHSSLRFELPTVSLLQFICLDYVTTTVSTAHKSRIWDFQLQLVCQPIKFTCLTCNSIVRQSCSYPLSGMRLQVRH
jgi:hypothetical protein